jgi:hypothetical protein
MPYSRLHVVTVCNCNCSCPCALARSCLRRQVRREFGQLAYQQAIVALSAVAEHGNRDPVFSIRIDRLQQLHPPFVRYVISSPSRHKPDGHPPVSHLTLLFHRASIILGVRHTNRAPAQIIFSGHTANHSLHGVLSVLA